MRCRNHGKFARKNKWSIATWKLLLLPTLVIANLLAVFISYCCYEEFMKPYDVRIVDGSIKTQSLSSLRKQVQKTSDDSMMHIQMNVNPMFYDEGLHGDFFIANSADNKDAIQVSIYLKKTHEEVLKTKALRAGATLGAQGLEKKLEKGTYAAIAYVKFLDEDEKLNAMNEIEMTLTIS